MSYRIVGWTRRVEKAGTKECPEHEWVESPYVVATNPPIRHSICSKCGEVIEEQAAVQWADDYDTIMGRCHP